MPTRPPSPDPSGQATGGTPFAGLGAGLDFFQDWMKAAGSALPNLQAQASPGKLGAWGLPTLDPEELDKRIQDLKTVQFWLEQNARMIAMTIQGLEVQKMTLSTLQGMNVSMDALRDALKVRTPEAAPAPAPAPAPPAEPEPPAAAAPPAPAGEDLINPMRWWDTLTEQFTHLATQAASASAAVSASVPRQAASPAPRPAAKKRARASSAAGKAPRKAAGKAAPKA
ncbi:MAG: hypothetical protein I8H88_08255 [Burkholderiales bacterium]|nr:hypothetical protein [Burkholderiales bacterium]